MATKKGENKAQSKTKIMPLADRVLLKEVADAQTQTQSGIYIPESADMDKGAKRGEVVAVGEGKYEEGKLIPIKLKAGDVVLYGWGDKMEIDGEKYVIVREAEISAVIK